jgi:2-phosphosulfolactate phosphatase
VDSVERCIQLGKELECVTAGERDGQVAPGLQYGNSSFEYPREFISGKTLVLTTTNGTKLLHMALARGATEIVTGSFLNLSAVCDHLVKEKKKCDPWLCSLEGSNQYGRQPVCRGGCFKNQRAFYPKL